MKHHPPFSLTPFFGLCILVIGASASTAWAQPSVDSLTLINANSDLPVAGFDPISEGAILDLKVVGANLNIRANTSPDGDFGSVRFVLTGATALTQVENVPVWAMAGNNDNNYNAFAFNPGDHMLTVTPYPQNGAAGTPGRALTLHFNVVDGAPPQAPSILEEPGDQAVLEAATAQFTVGVQGVEPLAHRWLADGEELSDGGRVSGAHSATLRLTDVRPADEGEYVCVITNEFGAVTSRQARLSVVGPETEGKVSGELKKWHRVTVAFDGAPTSEAAIPNPFRDMRLNVLFSHPDSGKSYRVPGFYAADGNAAETSATSGNQWQARFAPDEIGQWLYVASFRIGPAAAASDDPAAGTPGNFDGARGSFVVAPSDKTGRDLRAKGRLQYVGRHHLRFAETGEWFLKCGADAPENLLNYADFDDVPNVGNRQKTWSGHGDDYDPAEASVYTWQGGRGANLLGAIKYLSDKGMNAFSFLTFNLDGDDDNVFPHLLNGTVEDFAAAPNNRRWASDAVHHDRFDVSRMEQWERLFSYGDRKGMFLHFKTQETENEMWMDDGDTGLERRLYYRELIARFGHHLALNWNLGEEDGALGDVNQNTAQRRAMAQYFHDHDPYHHLIVIHNGKDPADLLGDTSKLTGFSLQTSRTNFSLVHGRTLTWIERSAAAGKPWVVACDEPGDATHALVPDADIDEYDPGRRNARQNALWGHLLAGGAGLEWYFGYRHDHSDLTCQDWRSRDLFWDQCRVALEFFRGHAVPFWEMSSADDLISATDGYCLAKPREVYVVFLKTAEPTSLDLQGVEGEFVVEWFDPRNGGSLRQGTVDRVIGGSTASLGAPPTDSAEDWVVLVRRAPTRLTLNVIPATEAVQLEWTDSRFHLQQAPEPTGTWSDVEPAGASPHPVGIVGVQQYFRLACSAPAPVPAIP